MSPSKHISQNNSLTNSGQKKTYVIRGTLRKKGLIFLNERDCSIDSEGILNYYHFDKPGDAKGIIDLKSAYVALIKFSYAGAKHQTGAKASSSQRPTPDVDDEFRITMANSETFIFRASKLATAVHNPCIEKWEKVIRKFSKNVRVGL